MNLSRLTSSRFLPTLAAAAFLIVAYLLDRAYAVDPQQVGKCIGRFWECWFWMFGVTVLFAVAALLYLRYQALTGRVHRLAHVPPLILAVVTALSPVLLAPPIHLLMRLFSLSFRDLPPIANVLPHLMLPIPRSFLVMAALLIALASMSVLARSARQKPEPAVLE